MSNQHKLVCVRDHITSVMAHQCFAATGLLCGNYLASALWVLAEEKVTGMCEICRNSFVTWQYMVESQARGLGTQHAGSCPCFSSHFGYTCFDLSGDLLPMCRPGLKPKSNTDIPLIASLG